MIRTITPIFSIIIAFVVFFFFTKPMLAEMKITQGKTAEFADAASKAEQLNTELSSMLNKKRAFEMKDIERLEVLVPQKIDEVRVLTDLNEMARVRNMLFGNVNVVNGDEEVVSSDVTEASVVTQNITYDAIRSTDITFSLIGTYDQFKSFLADVEQSLVMLEIMEMKFVVGEGDLQQYELTVRLFSLPPIE